MKPSKTPSATTIRALIADDEPNIRLVVRTALESEGYEVFEAADGRAVLEQVIARRPDILLLDLNMPSLDGMAVLERLRAVPAADRPRVIVLTAYGSVSAAVKAMRLGASDFLEKPVTPVALRETVRSVLSEPPPSITPAEPAEALVGYQGTLAAARKALRLGRLGEAEALLMRASDVAGSDAAYFNLLGLLYETQRRWSLAKKFYGKAIASDRHYPPSQLNMRRMYELTTFGRSDQPAVLGDEDETPSAALPGQPVTQAH